MRRLVLVLATALGVGLVLASQALGVGPWLWTVNGGAGIAASAGDTRYVARVAGTSTRLVERRAGRDARTLTIPGRWGLQSATVAGDLVGLSGDGRRLVLTGPTREQPLGTSRFVVVDTRTLAAPRTIRVPGNMTVDALSPDGRMLYLIQHVISRGASRYRVRAYDLLSEQLLARVIADKRQQGWLMTGMPVARAATADGARVYTLYQGVGNYPFVHVLDTVNATAVCIGLPLDWADPRAMDGAGLRLEPGRLAVFGPGIDETIEIDLRTQRVVQSPSAR